MVTGLIKVILEFFGKDFFGTLVVLNKWKPFTATVLGRRVVDVVPRVVVVDDVVGVLNSIPNSGIANGEIPVF